MGWIPVEDLHFPRVTYGASGGHALRELRGDSTTAEVPGMKHFTGGPLRVDAEIADLVLALNQAGIETAGSCQNLNDGMDDETDWRDLTFRIGAITVSMETFPKVKDTLPADWEDEDDWLFSADFGGRFGAQVTICFPWRDHDAWLAKLAKVSP